MDNADPPDKPKSGAAPQQPNPEAEAALAPLRKKIDELDQKLVALLNERARVVVEVGEVKRDRNGPIFAPERERRVLEQVKQLNKGPLPQSCIDAIWRELMSGSFALERPLRIGYLGPAGSFSHVAAKRKFGSSVEYDNLADIRMIFEAVDREHIDYGLVPIENSTEGFVTASLDCLMTTKAHVCAEVLTAIHHNLLANCDAPDIKKIYSHPQALAQCRHWLNAQFPNVEQVATASTSRAAEIAASEPGAGSAAIASLLAGQIFDLHPQFENIEDNTNNTTRFYIIAHQTTQPTGDDKTALMFTTEHRSGALADVLDIFRDERVNLTHIDKRPIQQVNWEYCFFIDLFGHASEPHVSAAIEKAKAHCLQLNVLGSFPRATGVL